VSLSQYFEDLNKAYRAELEDLQSDSEGKNVLAARLKEKRQQFAELMPMIEFAPEMVVPAFHTGITITNPHALVMLSFLEPEEFPSWDDLSHAVRFESWAEKLAAVALQERGGEQFMLTTICLEHLHAMSSGKGAVRRASSGEVDDAHDADGEHDEESGSDSDSDVDHNEHNEHIDGDDRDLEVVGADWLAEQGFDRRD
jgi:hypothetical protein